MVCLSFSSPHRDDSAFIVLPTTALSIAQFGHDQTITDNYDSCNEYKITQCNIKGYTTEYVNPNMS